MSELLPAVAVIGYFALLSLVYAMMYWTSRRHSAVLPIADGGRDLPGDAAARGQSTVTAGPVAPEADAAGRGRWVGDKPLRANLAKWACFVAVTGVSFLIIVYVFSNTTNYIIHLLGIPVTVSISLPYIALTSDVLPVSIPDARLLLLLAMGALLAGLWLFGKASVFFVFSSLNIAIVIMCVLLDLIAYKQIDAWGQVASGAFNFFLGAMFISICFFSILIRPSLRSAFRLFLCSSFSLFCLFTSVVVLSVFSMGFSGATLTFLFYAVLAYGAFGLHIWSLSWLLLGAEMRARPATLS